MCRQKSRFCGHEGNFGGDRNVLKLDCAECSKTGLCYYNYKFNKNDCTLMVFHGM